MFNPFAEVNWRPSEATCRRLVASLAAAAIAAAIAATLRAGLAEGRWTTAWIATTAGSSLAATMAAFLVPRFSRAIYLAWHVFSCSVGFVVINLAMTAFYFLAMTAFGLIARGSGRQRLQRRPRPSAASYWRDSDQPADAAAYFRQF